MPKAINDSSQASPRRLSITARLLLLTFAIVMVGFVLESSLQIQANYTHRKEALQNHAILLADLHATALAGPLWDFEYDMIAASLSGLDGAPNVLGARVTHPNGDLVRSVGSFPDDGSGAITARRKILWRGGGEQRLIGYFQIALSTAAIDRDLSNSIMTAGAIVAIIVIAILSALYVVVRHITQPLEALNHLMRRLAEGKRDIEIPYMDRDDEIGRVAQAVKLFRDNAEELDKLREDLELRVHEQTRDLRRAMEKAESASQAKSKFLSSMSHELRTPLNAIMGFAQLLELDVEKYKDNPRYGDAVGLILSSSDQLLELIEQVLNLAKIEDGDQDVRVENIHLAPLVRSVMVSQSALAERYNVRVDSFHGRIWDGRVMADASLLRQALHHLLSNAIKYNRPGGRAEVACKEADAEHVRLIVTDTGRGIPFSKRRDLFQPFQRLGAEASVVEGTGIGLVLAKKSVEAMGGRIDFESVIGTGSTFWIELPIASGPVEHAQPDATPDVPHAAETVTDASVPDSPPEPVSEPSPVSEEEIEPEPEIETAPPAPPAPPAPVAEPDGSYVLYVEDSPANAALMEQYFEVLEDAPKLRIATTGEEGIEMARASRPAIILMDVHLPGISGIEAMSQLRKTPECATTPIIAVSADAMSEEIDRALAEGFDDYLTKPIKFPQLKKLIDSHLGA